MIAVVTSVECSWAVMLCSSLKLRTAFAAFGPTWAKNWLNSSAKTDVSFVKAGPWISLDGIARFMIFHRELELVLLAETSSRVYSLSASSSFSFTKSRDSLKFFQSLSWRD